MPNIGERKEIGGTTGEWDGATWKRVYTNADAKGRPVDPFVPSPGMGDPSGAEAKEVTSGPGFRTPEFDAKYADAKAGAAQYHKERQAGYAKEQQAKMDSGKIDTDFWHAFAKRALAEQTPAKTAAMVGAAAAPFTFGSSIPAAALLAGGGSILGDMAQHQAADMGEETAQPRDLSDTLWGAAKAGGTEAVMGGLYRGAGMGIKAGKNALGYGAKTAYGAAEGADAAVAGARAYAGSGSGSGAASAATSPLHRTLDGVETVVDWTLPGYQSKAVKAGRTALFGNGKAASAADDILPSGARTIDAGDVQPAQQYKQSAWPREHASTEVPGSSWPVQGSEAGTRGPWNREDIVRKAEGRKIVDAANDEARRDPGARLNQWDRNDALPYGGLGSDAAKPLPQQATEFALDAPKVWRNNQWMEPWEAAKFDKSPPAPPTAVPSSQQEAANAMSALKAPDPAVDYARRGYEQQILDSETRDYAAEPLSRWFSNKNDPLWGANSTTRLGEVPVGRTKANLLKPAQMSGDELREALQNSKNTAEYEQYWKELRQRMHVEDGPKHGRKRTTAAGTARLIAERKAAYAKAQESGLPEDMMAAEALFAQRNK